MSPRIYALAKQLHLETKDLVDLVKKLGIEGKGSSLSNLTDEESDLVKAAVQKSAAKNAGYVVASPDGVLQRPALAATEKRIPVLGLPSKPKKDKAIVESTADKTEPPQESLRKESLRKTATTAQMVTAPEPVEKKQDVAEPSKAKLAKSTRSPSEKQAEEVSTASAQPVSGQVTAQAENSIPAAPEVLDVRSAPPTLPPPIGRIELPPSRTDRSSGAGGANGSRTKKASPLNAFLKKNEGQETGGKDSSGKSKSAAPPRPTIPPPPITTGLSEPGHAAAIRQEDYRGPMRSITDRIPNLDMRNRKSSETGAAGEKNGEKTNGKSSGRSVRLAPIPMTSSSRSVSSSKEPAPQKPDMKLPPELIPVRYVKSLGRSYSSA